MKYTKIVQKFLEMCIFLGTNGEYKKKQKEFCLHCSFLFTWDALIYILHKRTKEVVARLVQQKKKKNTESPEPDQKREKNG